MAPGDECFRDRGRGVGTESGGQDMATWSSRGGSISRTLGVSPDKVPWVDTITKGGSRGKYGGDIVGKGHP